MCDWASDKRAIGLSGIPIPAQALILAALERHLSLRKIVIAPSIGKQEELGSALNAWSVEYLVFPELLEEPGEGDICHSSSQAGVEQLAVLRSLQSSKKLLIATTKGASQFLPPPDELNRGMISVQLGQKIKIEDLCQKLDEAGYQKEYLVTACGQFARRGGIVDFWSFHSELAIRVEWIADEIESIREFDPVEQTSIRSLSQAELQLGHGEENQKRATLADYIPKESLRIFLNEEAGVETLPMEWADMRLHDLFHHARQDPVLAQNRRNLIRSLLENWMEHAFEVYLACNNEGEMKRLKEWMQDELPLGREWMERHAKYLFFIEARLSRGFVWPKAKLAILTDAEIFNRYQSIHLPSGGKRPGHRSSILRTRASLDLSELQMGDYVVHVDHGIALYGGMMSGKVSEEENAKESEIENKIESGVDAESKTPHAKDVLVLVFKDGARLYVPIDQAHLISRYVGVGKKHPPLDELGGTRWKKAKTQAQKTVLDYAAQLLQLQAKRATLPGYAFGSDTAWQVEFESSFIYQPTDDQLKAIRETKADMEQAKPMDRLICGDVGFGKTEVAIRAAFKAVMENKQVAFLVPTTILAHQHGETLSERMADYPIQINLLTRFQNKEEQKRTIEKIASGEIDIVIGTHRILSSDVKFKDLGLVIVDEEQRFGVKQKEQLKLRFPLVDVLTLSATPIPRTLYLSLVGARDMSTIDTPPPGRLAVETSVHPYDERIIRSAILRELSRGGQVYFLHNRVESIENVAARLKMLVPQGRIQIAHGQMESDELEEAMQRFVEKEADILLCTTIIESGLDIPNANTIIIDRADRFGLADLYQLRGRVGRSGTRAYAILLLPRELFTTSDARKRMQAMSEYAQLGAGYKIAMRDLELRGAGNFLGTAQSGQIGAVGFDLYCKLLKESIQKLKEEEAEKVADGRSGKIKTTHSVRDTYIWFDFMRLGEGEATASMSYGYIPASYIAELSLRVAAYRKLWEVSSRDELNQLSNQWRDSFGRWPQPVDLLLAAYRVKLAAAAVGIESVEVKEHKLKLKKHGGYIMQGHQFPRLTPKDPLSMLAEIEQCIEAI